MNSDTLLHLMTRDELVAAGWTLHTLDGKSWPTCAPSDYIKALLRDGSTVEGFGDDFRWMRSARGECDDDVIAWRLA